MNMVQNINRIKVMLAEKNKSNKWLAEQLQKDPATVSKWCTNKLQPGLQTLLEIANLLEVDIKELLNSSREDVTYIQINK
jgi:DNA-binding Xre family transcriptional regulator